jgi:hypothetical protein
MQRRWLRIGLVLFIAIGAGCAKAPQSHADAARAKDPLGALPAAAAQSPWPVMVVTKNASCGCCGAWVERMRATGFQVEVHDVDNLDPVKTRLGIPAGKGSCHTAEIGGYFVEGHVPAQDIKRLLAERPNAKGLVLPGMPLGSPGMEAPDGSVQPYTVELVDPQGETVAFAQH